MIKRKIYKVASINFIIFLIPVLLFTYLADEVLEKETMAFDVGLLNFIKGHSSPLLDKIIPFITNFSGAFAVIGFFIIMCIYYYLIHEVHNMLFLTLTIPGTVLFNTLLKIIFKRARPNLWDLLVKENFYSFPSGHAMVSTALVLSLIVICFNTKYFKLALGIGIPFILIIGFTRLYLGVHYPTDIVGGWLISSAWVYLSTKIMMRNSDFKRDFLESSL